MNNNQSLIKTLIFLTVIVSSSDAQLAAQPYYPLSGGTLGGSMNIPYGSEIQCPYYGFSSPAPQPATSNNVAMFPNSNKGTLDCIGWYNGWHFVPSGGNPYPTPVFKIDHSGNTEASGTISTGFGTQSYFQSGVYLNVGHTLNGYVPYISFNARLTESSIPNSSNKFSPLHAPGSGLIMAGEAGRSTLRFLQRKYQGDTNPVDMSSFEQSLSLNEDGEVGIGMNDLSITGYKLAVNGNIVAKRIKITQGSSGQWPDYVFEPSYQLPTLDSIELFVNTNKHLPGVPSAKETEKEGIDIGDYQAALLKKVEELTLYMIELNKKYKKNIILQQKQLESQSNEIKELKALIISKHNKK